MPLASRLLNRPFARSATVSRMVGTVVCSATGSRSAGHQAVEEIKRGQSTMTASAAR